MRKAKNLAKGRTLDQILAYDNASQNKTYRINKTSIVMSIVQFLSANFNSAANSNQSVHDRPCRECRRDLLEWKHCFTYSFKCLLTLHHLSKISKKHDSNGMSTSDPYNCSSKILLIRSTDDRFARIGKKNRRAAAT